MPIPLPSDIITTSRQFDGPCAPAVTTTSDGITRDLFAAHALQGLIGRGNGVAPAAELAPKAYEYADAMMAERARRPK